MKKLNYIALVVGLLGLLSSYRPMNAQEPLRNPESAGGAGPAAAATRSPSSAVAPGQVSAPVHCPACVQKVCRPDTDIKKTTKTVYSCKEVDFCLTRCTIGSLFSKKSCCDECPSCANCDKPRTRRVLIKKFVPQEECITKCVVEHVAVPVCDHACPAPTCTAPLPASPLPEPLPPPKGN